MIDILGRTPTTQSEPEHASWIDPGAMWKHVSDAGRGSVKRVESTMVSHPAGTLIVSLSIGVVLGWIIKRLI